MLWIGTALFFTHKRILQMNLSKLLYTLFFVALVPLASLACDICGSGAGGSYLGILPEFRKHFFGLRYQHNGLTSHLGPDGATSYLTTQEKFHTTEAWGATQFGKFRITAFVPYTFISRTNGTGTEEQDGIGDISLIGYYNLLSKKQTTTSSKLLAQSLWLGGGIKLPTGRYDPEEKNVLSASQNTFQLGTGSLDFSINAAYDVRIQDWGLNINAAYRLTQPNQYDYRYGNKVTINSLLYHKFNIFNKLMLSPNAGLLLESAAKDHKTDDIQVWETGGRSLMGIGGLELNIGKVAFGGSYQSPIAQRLGEEKLKAKHRVIMHVSYVL
jgi:hypothetical protein